MNDTTPDNAAVYTATRDRIVALLRGASDGEHLTPVAACPGWTVRDLAGHLSGVVTDISAGRLDGMAGDEWTARQVAERRGWHLERVLDEWASNMGAIATVPKPFDAILVADVCSHEHDLRSALGRPGARDDDAVHVGAATMLGGLHRRLREAGAPALLVVHDGGTGVVGDGEPGATLTIGDFELLRALSGRRTPDQVRAYDWDGDPAPYLGSFFLFGPAAAPLEE